MVGCTAGILDSYAVHRSVAGQDLVLVTHAHCVLFCYALMLYSRVLHTAAAGHYRYLYKHRLRP